MNFDSQVGMFIKGFVQQGGILLSSVLWTLLMGKHSQHILDILYYLISGLSYHSTNVFTITRVKKVLCKNHVSRVGKKNY